MDSIKAELEAAGYTNVVAIRKGRWYTATKGNEGCAIGIQAPNAWHWFSAKHAATASGSSAKNCDSGGLGDVVGDDREMAAYKRLIRQVPKGLLDLEGVYAASSQVYNDE
jgi:hypothetical protein